MGGVWVRERPKGRCVGDREVQGPGRGRHVPAEGVGRLVSASAEVGSSGPRALVCAFFFFLGAAGGVVAGEKDGVGMQVADLGEGVDICWAEEAANISKHSWGVLIPTIRSDDSEIWLSFNPELETDYTYKHFVLDTRLVSVAQPGIRFGAEPSLKRLFGEGFALAPITCPVKESQDILAVRVSWRDNPWFPDVLKREMEKLKEEDYDQYLHVWEGATKQNLEGSVYAKELRAAQLEGRICSVPYEADVPVDTFWDLGRANNTAIWFIQRVSMQWRVLDYYEANLEELSHYFKVCQARGYFYGTMFLPHDAKHKKLGYRHSIEEQFRGSGYRVHIVPAMSRIDAINASKVALPNCWFDEERCQDGLTALRHYRYKVDDRGQLSQEPLHDEYSDGADAFGHFAVTTRVRRVGVDAGASAPSLASRLNKAAAAVATVGGLGWMR